jgi:hypothetical protein
MVKTFQNMDFSHFELPALEQDYTVEYLMEFVPLGSSEGTTLEVPVTDEFQRFEFDFPTELQPNTIYCVQFLARWTKEQTQQTILPIVFELKALQSWNPDGYKVTQSRREINLDKLAIAANEKKLYGFYFKTSEFLGYREKLNSLDVNEAVFNITYFSDKAFKDKLADDNNNNGTGYVYLHQSEMETPQQMADNMKQKLNLGPNDQIPMIAPSEICMIGDEPFDVFDIEGYSNTITKGAITKTVDLDPLMTIDNIYVSSWVSQMMNNIVDTLCSSGEATRLEYIPYNKKIGGTIVTSEIDHPAAPPLTEAEIFDGTAMHYNIPKASSTCQDRKREIYTKPTPPAGNNTGSMGYLMGNTLIATGITGSTLDAGAQSTFNSNAHVNTNVPQNNQQSTQQNLYSAGVDYMFHEGIPPQALLQPGKVNVINVSYRYNNKSGEGIPTIPNLLLEKTIIYTNPSPELTNSYWSAVGQAFDYAQSEVGSVNTTESTISASFIGQVSGSSANVNIDLGGTANIGAGF